MCQSEGVKDAPAPDLATRRRGRPPGPSTQGADTKERIRQAAIDLFAEKGFHGTAVADIGDRVDIQRGALYYHIGSKNELLWEVLGGFVRGMLGDIDTAVTEDIEPVEKFRRLMRLHVRRITAHQREVAIHLRDGGALTGDRAPQFQALRDQVQQRWQEVVDECQRTGAFTTADHVVVNGLLGMVNMVYLWYQEGRGDSPEQIADKFTDMVLHGLLKPADDGT